MKKFGLLLVIILQALFAHSPAAAQTPTPTYDFDGYFFPPGLYEAEDYEDFAAAYGMICAGTGGGWEVVNNPAWSGGAALHFTAANSMCTFLFYGSSITFWRQYNYGTGATPAAAQLSIDSNEPVDFANGAGDTIIYSYPFTIGFSTSSYHGVTLLSEAGNGFYIDRFYVADPLMTATAIPTPVIIAGADFMAVNGSPNPARYYGDTGGQIVAVDRSVTAGDIVISVLLFGLFCALVVALAARIWAVGHA